MQTARRTQTSPRWRMRHVRTLIAGTAVAAAALSVVGLTATAQAAPDVAATAKTVNIPAGVATATLSPACPSGNTASLSSSTPALPASVTAVTATTKLKLAGVFPGSPTSYKIKVGCSGGSTISLTVKVQSAPPENAAVGLGADTQEYLVDQFSGDYNATISSSTATHLYNWDATNPVTGALSDTITIKQNCAPIPRPNGSSAGIKQLATFATTSDNHNIYCDNFADDARPRASTDPSFGPGGVAFVALAADAVTWATPKTTDAPASLTPTQLNEIYTCTLTNWDQVGGKNAPIQPFVPQSGAGTGTFFLGAIGVTTPGPCVSSDNNTLEQNEGVNPVLHTPEAIWIYSIGQYIGQRYHSPACTNSGCTASPPCTPRAGKNEFGCDLHGTYVLKEINGIAPTTGTNEGTKINPAFDATFDRVLYQVVPYDPSTTDHIPGAESGAPGGVNLEKIFGASGWACTNASAKLDIKNYGFESIPTCGATS
jgi:ABC-type phosphate transport system substrate-binding protein